MARRALFASLAAVALGLGAAAQGAASADPALAHAHKLEQQEILEKAFSLG